MSVWNRAVMAITQALKVFSDPSSVQNDLDVNKRITEYSRAWAYYRQKMFSPEIYDFTYYLNERGLYQHTKLIFNPVPEIVNFYVDNIWQRTFNRDFPRLVTPLADDTDPQIIEAVSQLDQWTNWQTESNKIKRFAAATGNVLIEGHADYDRQKITQKTVWASYVTDIQLNDAGDVLSYTLEYDVYDAAAKQTYRYKKIADKDKTQYFRGGKPFATDSHEAVEPNPLGFCFAVWLKHDDDGGAIGIPAVTNFDKVDHTNSLASHLHDNIHKEIESGKIIGIDDPNTIDVVAGATKNKDGTIKEYDTRLERVLLAGAGAVSVNDLSGKVKLAEAHPYLKELILSFADDYPEIEYRHIMKESGALSGIALERLLTPVQNRLDRYAPNYDQQLIKLRQMQITAGAYYLRNEWKNASQQQRVFSPFNDKSYDNGELDFQLKPSLLVEQTEDEREDILTKKAARAVTVQTFADIKAQREIAGFSELEIEELEKRDAAQRQVETVVI